jgi:hypothetical protein
MMLMLLLLLLFLFLFLLLLLLLIDGGLLICRKLLPLHVWHVVVAPFVSRSIDHESVSQRTRMRQCRAWPSRLLHSRPTLQPMHTNTPCCNRASAAAAAQLPKPVTAQSA